MFKSYLKAALRNFLKYKTQSANNIIGLSVGMAVVLLIGLWIRDELSFNKYHQNYDRIAEVQSHVNYNGETVTINAQPMPLAAEIHSAYGLDFEYVVMSTHTERHMLSSGDNKFSESGKFMQPEAPDMLTLKMLKGSRAGLKELNAVLLTASLANKLFGDTDPINKIVKIDNNINVKVTGVYEDLPDNADFKDMSFISPFQLYLSSYDWARKKYADWDDIAVSIYVQIKPGLQFDLASAHIKDALTSHIGSELVKTKPILFLQPMSRWHLYSKFENGVNVTSDQLQYIRFYAVIGLFVLLLACINFMNLSTARSEQRAKEVGIRKVMGSLRRQLISQFFSESLTLSGLSFLVAITIVQISLPWFNQVADKKISVPWNDPVFWVAGLAFALFTGMVAGSYPAIYLSSFHPAKVLKGTFRAGRRAAIPRKALVVVQFTVSTMLFIGTVVVYRQIQHAKSRPVGYLSQALLQIPINSPEFQDNYQIFRNEVKNTGLVSEVAESASPVTGIWSTNTGFTWRGKQNTTATEFSTINISSEYGKTIGWQLTKGRDFSSDRATDSGGLVINEAAANLLGMQDPVGESIEWDQVKGRPFKILGVVKNILMESPFNRITPTIFFVYKRDGVNFIFLKLHPQANANSAMAKIAAIFKKINPNTSFEYSFVNDEFRKKFAAEERIGTLAGLFASLAILISCMGLFGLVSFVAEQRTKEISVRKVLGASVFDIWKILNREFVMQVSIALVIAIPASYYLMGNWLQHYVYRSNLSWWIFASAALSALLVTLLTAGYQTIKAALMTPAGNLGKV